MTGKFGILIMKEEEVNENISIDLNDVKYLRQTKKITSKIASYDQLVYIQKNHVVFLISYFDIDENMDKDEIHNVFNTQTSFCIFNLQQCFFEYTE